MAPYSSSRVTHDNICNLDPCTATLDEMFAHAFSLAATMKILTKGRV